MIPPEWKKLISQVPSLPLMILGYKKMILIKQMDMLRYQSIFRHFSYSIQTISKKLLKKKVFFRYNFSLNDYLKSKLIEKN